MISKTPVGFLDTKLVTWEPEAGIEGLYSTTLARCDSTGSYSRLLKFLPGVDTSPAGVQRHSHLEELWIVEGAIHDLSLDRLFVKGMYANRLVGMDHGPWRAPTGCITLEVRDNDSEGLIAKDQLEFFDPALVPWRALNEGVSVKTLSACRETGSYGRLVRLSAIAELSWDERKPEPIRSEIYVVSGTLVSKVDGGTYAAGTYGNLEIDLTGGDWSTPSGCTVFEIRNRI